MISNSPLDVYLIHMIKAYIFDWGGVIIDNPTEDFCHYFSKKLHIHTSLFNQALSILSREYSLGLSEREFWKKLYAYLSINPSLPIPSWSEALPILFHEKKHITGTIQKLRLQGKKIALLSNTELPTAHFFASQAYAHLFDIAVFSCFEKIMKPDPTIYSLTLDKLQILPEEAVYVDDKRENVDVAQQLGMQGIVFDNEQNVIKKLLNAE